MLNKQRENRAGKNGKRVPMNTRLQSKPVGVAAAIRKNCVIAGDCRNLIPTLPDESIDVVVTSPPYWGQRLSIGNGVENDPRDYLRNLEDIFLAILPKLKQKGILWVNMGDAYNTPVNWTPDGWQYSTLGADKAGFDKNNIAYTKPRHKRRSFVDQNVSWLTYGNMLALPQRLILGMVGGGYLLRGEVFWRKRNAMPEGRCRRPHRKHETIYLLAKNERHNFRVSPPVESVWEFANDRISGKSHHSRFPLELPMRCIDAYGYTGANVVVFDPFSGSGTTGMAAVRSGCSYLGFEIDPEHVEASNIRIAEAGRQPRIL